MLYPAAAAALSPQPVQTFSAQEPYAVSDKDAPLRVHYLYNRWRGCGQKMLRRRAADGELDKSGVSTCAPWFHALCCSKCNLNLHIACRRTDLHGHVQQSASCKVCMSAASTLPCAAAHQTCHACVDQYWRAPQRRAGPCCTALQASSHCLRCVSSTVAALQTGPPSHATECGVDVDRPCSLRVCAEVSPV